MGNVNLNVVIALSLGLNNAMMEIKIRMMAATNADTIAQNTVIAVLI